MRSAALSALLAVALILPSQTEAKKKPKYACPDGWSLASPAKRKICYRIDRTHTEDGRTRVYGKIKTARTYQSIGLALYFHRDGRVVDKLAVLIGEEVPRDEEVAWATIGSSDQRPEQITVRVEGTMP